MLCRALANANELARRKVVGVHTIPDRSARQQRQIRKLVLQFTYKCDVSTPTTRATLPHAHTTRSTNKRKRQGGSTLLDLHVVVKIDLPAGANSTNADGHIPHKDHRLYSLTSTCVLRNVSKHTRREAAKTSLGVQMRTLTDVWGPTENRKWHTTNVMAHHVMIIRVGVTSVTPVDLRQHKTDQRSRDCRRDYIIKLPVQQ